jgi:H+/Cl- antiporter ClcA
MPVEAPTRDERVTREAPPAGTPASEDETLREVARRHVEHARKLRLYAFVYVVSMLVLTPVWVVTQYETSPGWPEHLSTRSRYAGDWDPWIVWVALIGGAIVAVAWYRVHADRSEGVDDVERELERMKRRG